MIDNLLAYMKPKATHKQGSLIATLESMKTRVTHAEAYPDEYMQGAKNGKGWINKLAEIRNDSCSIEDIYASDPKLLAWWKSL
jgi:hypothetical protein